MMCQHDFKKPPLNPSGPGALSDGIFLTTASISVWEKGKDRASKPPTFLMSLRKSSTRSTSLDVPNLSLKVWYRRASFPTWSDITEPSGWIKVAMEFRLYRPVATRWKNLVFPSPNLKYLTVS